MHIFHLTESDKQQYNDFVAHQPGASFLQAWEWGEFTASLGIPAYRYMITDGDIPSLAAQTLHITIPRLRSSYLYIPYGPVMSDPQRAAIFPMLIKQLRHDVPQALCIRCEPTVYAPTGDVRTTTTSRTQPGKTLVVDLTKPADALLNDMHPKTRYNIKVAERHGVQIIQSNDTVSIADLVADTARRQGYRSHGAEYYRKLISFFQNKPHATILATAYAALLEGKLLAAAIMIDFAGARTYLFGGSTDDHRNVMAPYLLHWTAIQDAKAQGFTRYDFWGIETSSGGAPGFVRFKLGFGGTPVSYPESFDIILHPFKYRAYTTLRFLNRKLR